LGAYSQSFPYPSPNRRRTAEHGNAAASNRIRGKFQSRRRRDERVLGDSDFVETVLNSASEAMERRYRLKAEGYTFKSVAERVGEIFDMPNRDVMAPGKQPHRVKARSVLAYWAVHELGMSATDVGLKLGLSQSAASRAVQRGRVIAQESGLNIEIAKNA